MSLTTRELISDIVAEAINDFDNGSGSENEIREKFRDKIRDVIECEGLARDEFEKEWENAVVFSIDSHLPGCLPDNLPHFFPEDKSIKDAVVYELEEAFETDNKGDNESNRAWINLISEVKNTPNEKFQNGVSIRCPDGYIISIDRNLCASVISFDMKEILDEIESEREIHGLS